MIGVFDSGLGGLFAVRALRRRLPNADILYYADEAYLPYGEKPPALLLARARAITAGLRSLGARALFAACGTLGAVALPHLTNECSLPLYGIIEPLAKKTAREAKSGGEILLLATEATLRSGVLAAKIAALATHAPLHTLPCPAFVRLVEGWREAKEREILRCVEEALTPYLHKEIGVVALGCTHFSPLAPYISRLCPRATVVDGAREGAAAVAAAPPRLATGKGALRILTSGDPAAFRLRAEPHFSPLFFRNTVEYYAF